MEYVGTVFQDSFIFGEASSLYFFRVTASTQQLLFRSSYSFRAATVFEEFLFRNSRFFAAVIFFQNSCIFRVKHLPSSQFLRIVLQDICFVGTATFLMKEVVKILSCQVLLHSDNFFRADTFSTKALFQKRYFFTWIYNTQYNYCIIISLVFYPCFSEQSLFEKS